MIRIVNRTHTALSCGEVLEILADTEDDIKALDDVVRDAYEECTAAPGSMAYTADMQAIYQMSPSRVWTKVG